MMLKHKTDTNRMKTIACRSYNRFTLLNQNDDEILSDDHVYQNVLKMNGP